MNAAITTHNRHNATAMMWHNAGVARVGVLYRLRIITSYKVYYTQLFILKLFYKYILMRVEAKRGKGIGLPRPSTPPPVLHYIIYK